VSGDLSPFERDVAAVLTRLRPGEVVTYGEVAAEAGHPGAARAVGSFLRRHDGYAWWRVVTAGGRLVPGHEEAQAERLVAEGCTVVDGRVHATPPSAPGSRAGRASG
jgi:methylated-DNA-protein-cysteine methyltransferase-like protein